MNGRLILSLIFFTCLVIPSHSNGEKDSTLCQGKVNELSFFGKCFCMPGWERSKTDEKCTRPVDFSDCWCLPGGLFNHSAPWPSENAKKAGGDGRIRCMGLCNSNSEVGAPFAIVEEWKDNQVWRQESFYRKELHQTKNPHRRNHLRTRLIEFSDAYANWHYLEGINLGNVIEFGAGGYTQTRNMLEHVNAKMASVVLVDPLINSYKKMDGCSYASGQLMVNGTTYPTVLSNDTAESYFDRDINKSVQYDTVVIMNVMVYSLNALKFLTNIHRAVKPGGLLIFHDRYFQNIERSSKCKTSGFLINTVQASKIVIDHFLAQFEVKPVFLNLNQTEGERSRSRDWCLNLDDERSYFGVWRKP